MTFSFFFLKEHFVALFFLMFFAMVFFFLFFFFNVLSLNHFLKLIAENLVLAKR